MTKKSYFRPKTLSASDVAHFEEATMDHIDPAKVRGRQKVRRLPVRLRKRAALLLGAVTAALTAGATAEEIAAALEVDVEIVKEIANEA